MAIVAQPYGAPPKQQRRRRFERATVHRDSRRRTSALWQHRRNGASPAAHVDHPYIGDTRNGEVNELRQLSPICELTYFTRSPLSRQLGLQDALPIVALNSSPFHRPFLKTSRHCNSAAKLDADEPSSPASSAPASALDHKNQLQHKNGGDDGARCPPQSALAHELAERRQMPISTNAAKLAGVCSGQPPDCSSQEAGCSNSLDMVFKKVLRDPHLRQPFHEFLEQQFCAENLNFYVAVEQFRDQNFHNVTKIGERAAMARRIFERYFAQNSTEPVNIDNSTSKRIRETIESGVFPRNTFDVAQYQIFHLLKYDCWPRFLRAGGFQPDFTDDELTEEDDRQRRIELGEDVEPVQLVRRPSGRTTSGIPKLPPTAASSTTQPQKTTCTDSSSMIEVSSKRKSLLWHGLDRFSRRLRRGESTAVASATPPATSDEPPRSTDVDGNRRRRSYSSDVPQSASLQKSRDESSRRRHQFVAGGKQHSMPVEPNVGDGRRRQPAAVTLPPPPVQPKFCRLVIAGDVTAQINEVVVELNDPTQSVRAWTKQQAATLGMDIRSTQVVDAETGSSIDPARQALDALQSRAVRLVPVVTIIIEVLPPNYSFRHPTPTKIIVVRARHSLSTGGALRPLLLKWFAAAPSSCSSPQTSNCPAVPIVIVYNGTMEVIRSSVSVGRLTPGKSLLALTQSQHEECVQLGRTELPEPRDAVVQQPYLLDETRLAFHQYGDVSYCELSSTNEARAFYQRQHEKDGGNSSSSLGLLNKFVRRKTPHDASSPRCASSPPPTAAASSSTTTVSPNAVAQPRHKATSGGVYCGEENAGDAFANRGGDCSSSISTTTGTSTRKRLSIFKSKSKEAPAERAMQMQPRPMTVQPRPVAMVTSSSSSSSSQAQSTAAVAAAVPTAKSNNNNNNHHHATLTTSTSPSNGPQADETPSIAGLPRIFSTKVCQNESEEPASMTMTAGGWQPAAYV